MEESNPEKSYSMMRKYFFFTGKLQINQDKKSPQRALFIRYTEEDLPFVRYYTISVSYRQYLVSLRQDLDFMVIDCIFLTISKSS